VLYVLGTHKGAWGVHKGAWGTHKGGWGLHEGVWGVHEGGCHSSVHPNKLLCRVGFEPLVCDWNMSFKHC